MELKSEDLKFLRELYTWKMNSPEEYKEFLIQIKSIMKDLFNVSKELSEELEL